MINGVSDNKTPSAQANPLIRKGIQTSGIATTVNLMLAIIKIASGIIGNSFALVADGIESTTDIFSSLIVIGGLRISEIPPDSNHPYGHGKAESLSGIIISLFLFGSAIFIALQSIQGISSSHQPPAWYTLVVLSVVILLKEALYRYAFNVGNKIKSTSLKCDAWHHRSDAITSLTAFIGIAIALLGGKGYETADDWAALVGCAFIVYNGIKLLFPALDEVMDATVPKEVKVNIIELARSVDGVVDTEKCRIRKSGLGLLMDIHIIVDGNLPVREGHIISHLVKDRLYQSAFEIHDVVVHIEPDDTFQKHPHGLQSTL